MAFSYEASAALLSEMWSALRQPIKPWKSALTDQAIRECFAGACRRGGRHFHTCIETILFRAAGYIQLTPKMRGEMAAVFGVSSLSPFRSPHDPCLATALPDVPIAAIAVFCVKLEMLGFDIDSGPICEIAERELQHQPNPRKMAVPREIDPRRIEERHKSHVILQARNGREHRTIRTLRTHRGFIIQAYLANDLHPIRLDMFGPKYNSVSDWMDLLTANRAWSLELRDAPGYNSGALAQNVFSRNVTRSA